MGGSPFASAPHQSAVVTSGPPNTIVVHHSDGGNWVSKGFGASIGWSLGGMFMFCVLLALPCLGVAFVLGVLFVLAALS